MGFRVSLVKLGVINVILIATAVNLSKLKEQFEVFELWLFQYSYNIAKLNCRCLKIAYHKDKHKKGLLERSICTYLRYFFLFKERQIELRVWSKVDWLASFSFDILAADPKFRLQVVFHELNVWQDCLTVLVRVVPFLTQILNTFHRAKIH